MTSLQQANLKIKDLKIQLDNQQIKFQVREEEYKKEISDLKNEIKEMKSVINSLVNQVTILQKENVQLKEEVKYYKQENKQLKEEVDKLKSKINKNSNNSSKPPSTDIKPNKKEIPNNREKGNKSIGGQKGHKGYFLSKKEVERKIKNKEFKHEIINVGNITEKYISKYKLDICVEVKAIEYRFYADEKGKIKIPKQFKTDVQYGPELKTLCTILNVKDVVAIDRLTDFVSLITHGKINMSNATIVNITKEISSKVKTLLNNVEEKIMNAPLIYTDATTSRCGCKNVSSRNFSTKEYTILKCANSKSQKSIENMGVLNDFIGTIVHDHETVMYNFGTEHVECNAHISRYLKGCYQSTKNSWSRDMRIFLCSLNEYKKKLISKGIVEISKEQNEKYSKRYNEIINKGYEENKKVKSKYYAKEEKRLLNRLKKYKDNHLMFILNFAMPFDNNLSERELRHVKIKQKISGTFKNLESLQDYLNIKSIIITSIKKGIDYFNLIKDIFSNKPVTI